MNRTPLCALIGLVALSGCFNEPEPAYKSVPAGARVYLSEKGLADLHRQKLDAAQIDYLNLDRNQLTNITEVTACTGIKWLRLNENRLTALPDLKPLTKLRRIYLRGNRLATVPETLKDLPNLTDIDLSQNPITTVPDWLTKLPGLKNISFSRTLVTRLPEDLTGWQKLQSLQLGELRLPADEMARIRKALPNVAIVF